MLSSATTAVLKGANDTNFTIWENRPGSEVEASTWGSREPISSNSFTLNKANPAACSKRTNRFSV